VPLCEFTFIPFQEESNGSAATAFRTAGAGSFALTLLQEIATTGDDPARLLGRIGLPFTLADLQQGRVQLLTDAQFIQLYRECITVLSVHANRERNLPPMSKDEVDMLCYCVITCATLAEVIERARRFCAMLDHRAADLSLDVKAGEATFHMATQRLRHSASGLLTDLSGLSFYHRLFSWLIGEPIRIDGYGVYSEAQADRAMLERFFQQPIRFGEPDNHFSFPARYLDKPVVRSYQRLVERLSVLPSITCATRPAPTAASARRSSTSSRPARTRQDIPTRSSSPASST
jgi:hypothetical protein